MSAGGKLTGKQEAVITVLLTEPTHVSGAARAGVSEATRQRWLRLPEFQAVHQGVDPRQVVLGRGPLGQDRRQGCFVVRVGGRIVEGGHTADEDVVAD
jgi:hypothetical protein